MDNEKLLDGMAEGGVDPGRKNLRANFCVDDCSRCSFFGDRLAPCNQCEWSSLCPEYADISRWLTGGRADGKAAAAR